MKGSHEARKRILVVDDEESIRKTLKLLLESEGYEVITANNGKDWALTSRLSTSTWMGWMAWHSVAKRGLTRVPAR